MTSVRLAPIDQRHPAAGRDLVAPEHVRRRWRVRGTTDLAQEPDVIAVLELARVQPGGRAEPHRQDRRALRMLERLPHPEIGGERKRREQLGPPDRRRPIERGLRRRREGRSRHGS